jgi:hypothetical protein
MNDDRDLPFIDTVGIDVGASPERCWAALTSSVGGLMAGRPAQALALLLGCDDRVAEGPSEAAGSALAGFHVVRSERPWRWYLRGAHRFAEYSLAFRIADLGQGRSRVEAESRGRFPGWHGTLYRTLVVGSTGHRRAVRRMLEEVRRRAERSNSARTPWGSDPSPTSAAPPPGRPSASAEFE